MFNSLKYVKILESSGLPRNQAETHIQILGDLIGEEMVTKEDLKTEISSLGLEMHSEFKSVRSDMAVEFKSVRAEMTSEFESVRAEMRSEFKSVRSDMAAEFKNVRHEMKSEFKNVRHEMKSEFKSVRLEMVNLENRLVVKLGGLMAAFLTIAVTATQVLS